VFGERLYRSKQFRIAAKLRFASARVSIDVRRLLLALQRNTDEDVRSVSWLVISPVTVVLMEDVPAILLPVVITSVTVIDMVVVLVSVVMVVGVRGGAERYRRRKRCGRR
jgi:hypothetical protein